MLRSRKARETEEKWLACDRGKASVHNFPLECICFLEDAHLFVPSHHNTRSASYCCSLCQFGVFFSGLLFNPGWRFQSPWLFRSNCAVYAVPYLCGGSSLVLNLLSLLPPCSLLVRTPFLFSTWGIIRCADWLKWLDRGTMKGLVDQMHEVVRDF